VYSVRQQLILNELIVVDFYLRAFFTNLNHYGRQEE